MSVIPSTFKAIRQIMSKIVNLLTRATRKVLLGPREALLLLRMAGWVLLLSAAVKVFSLPRALRLVSTKIRRRAPTKERETQVRLAHAIDLLLRADLFIFKPSCWKRAALLHRYLALNGMASRIVFGMRREVNGDLSGHAWLEAKDGPILESTAPNYAVTYAFPSNQAFEVDLNLLEER
ncbi:MAG: lasso peptide biosynthesis B2 protein [Acidobacteria bacterium]|nr:lasso peptide biosynthesis B2 protein [Acidobacteriota bacterium]